MMLQRSTERRTFGKYLYEHGSVQEMIAKSFTDIELARCITLSCANQMDDVGIKLARQQIAMIKVIVPQLTYNVVDRAVQLYGGAGVCNDTILARSLVGLRTLRIADGPDAVHQRTIARIEIQNILKKNKQKNKENQSNYDINSQSKRMSYPTTQSRL
jgi:acyl-CoA dehydrogenase